ncbi:uncharacterized protein LOC126746544 [Anthonomus grandis grandis]|uniref:uncharacterized protein LOC126746544 n=1 Tax=Anthonomus grandis grandis TaxID=2921223 RepID=UPI002166B68A|nr:uncharacterized protein LOC126746544 [Anthonomus grandis grandis]
MPVICKLCDKSYSTQFNLNKHCRQNHGKQIQEHSYDENVFKFKCLMCKCSYPRNVQLCNHLQKEHDQKIEEEKLEFESLEEFQSWKHDLEERELCNYVVLAGKKKTPSCELQYFVCNRSGTSKSINDVTKRKRNIKSQGLSKLEYNCISKITLKRSNGKFQVHRIITHYGHSTAIEHLKISSLDKKQIAVKLVGVSTVRILDDTRNKIGGETKRVDLLTRQDVDNIKRRYNIHNKEGVKHKNDAISIEIWVEECRSLENNPVLFYKPQGEALKDFVNSDFCLIIMNDLQASLLKQFGENIIAIASTHGLNNYDFELTTLMIVDEFNEGFPVAFKFSNKKDTFTNNIFFSKIKQKVGTIKSNTFMSDITGTFYNGWVQVMGLSRFQLYCSWHVDRAWRTNLSKISNKEDKVWVYKTLKYLQKTTDFDSINTFCEHLRVAINNMSENAHTKIFGEYFEKNYSNNYQKWAYYFRQECGINTNMRLESLHKVIKYFYLNGKCVKRLDKGLHATLKYLRDKTVDRLIKHTKGKSTCKSHEIFKSHRMAVSSSFDLVVQTPGIWAVSNNLNKYIVKQIPLLKKCCSLICQFCDICVHQYSCTCPNYFINTVICKHIHFVVLKTPVNNNVNTNSLHSYSILDEGVDVINEVEEVSVMDQCLSSLKATNGETIGRCDQKDRVLKEISHLQTLVHSYDFDSDHDNIFQQVISNIQTAKNLLQLPTSKQSTIETFRDIKELSASQNVVPQKRLFSTIKKKKKAKEAIKNPNKEEIDDISAFLKGKKLPFISTNSTFDHSYI